MSKRYLVMFWTTSFKFHSYVDIIICMKVSFGAIILYDVEGFALLSPDNFLDFHAEVSKYYL